MLCTSAGVARLALPSGVVGGNHIHRGPLGMSASSLHRTIWCSSTRSLISSAKASVVCMYVCMYVCVCACLRGYVCFVVAYNYLVLVYNKFDFFGAGLCCMHVCVAYDDSNSQGNTRTNKVNKTHTRRQFPRSVRAQ
jgi:hypothetical protein